MSVKSLLGAKFGRLLVVEQATSRKGRSYWLCKCNCGKSVVVLGKSMTTGNTQSCGCLHRERAAEANVTHNMAVKGEEHPIWRAWSNMRKRCDYSKNNRYHLYGGRGITYDPAWAEFMNFKRDMEPGWKRGLTLDRIDVNGNYSKENCRWATRQQQARNKQNNRLLTFQGATKTAKEWADINGVTHAAINYRLAQGWTVEEALSKPFRRGYKK